MCLSTVYKGNAADAENLLAEYVTSVESDDGTIRLTDITGEEITVRGVLRHIDLIANRIYIDTPA